MTTTINASTSSGLVQTADTSGILQLQTANTAALSISSSQIVTVVNDATVNGVTVGKGGGSGASNTAIGRNAQVASVGDYEVVAIGNNALYNNVATGSNTAVGSNSMYTNTTGSLNAAFGKNTLYYNTSGTYNTAIGIQALQSNTTASNNTAVGYQAAYTNSTNTGLTAVGYQALNKSVADYNSAFGIQALQNTTSGTLNTASGAFALQANTTGSNNTAHGTSALASNTTASNNTAVGYQAGYSNTTGTENTFLGNKAGYAATNAYNTVIGSNAGIAFTTGVGQTLIGSYAGTAITTGGVNTFIGLNSGNAVTTGSKNSILGAYTGNQGGLDIRTASNYIVLSDGDGNPRVYVDNNAKVFLGRVPNGGTGGTDTVVVSNTSTIGQIVVQTYSTPVNWSFGATSSNLFGFWDGGGTIQAYFQGSNGNAYNRGGTWGTISDIKLKENIVDATPKLDEVMQLKVRNFNLKDDSVKQIGFVAQEIQQVFPSIVEAIDDVAEDGSIANTQTLHVKTSVLVPILVKAIQELKAEVDSLKQQLGK